MVYNNKHFDQKFGEICGGENVYEVDTSCKTVFGGVVMGLQRCLILNSISSVTMFNSELNSTLNC